LFPFERKATAVNFIILVSKFFTIGAAFANELPEPMPLVLIGGLCLLSLLLSLVFPTKQELDSMKEK
jgi:hypothetical protein